MVIGLYDIDLFHNSSKFPNLELMKIYNYHLQHNDKVLLMNPKSDEGRFTEIVYFKEVPSYSVPKSISLSGSKKHIYGYGFYKKYNPINAKYHDVPPLHLVYAPYADKMKSNYNNLICGSIVRCENEDYSGLKKEGNTLLVADYDFINLPNSKDFARQFQRYNLLFRTNFRPQDIKTYIKFIPYKHILRNRFYINFPYSFDFFKENIDEYTWYHLEKPLENENESHYLNRLIRTILTYKNLGAKLPFFQCSDGNKIENYILKWGLSSTSAAYSEFYRNYKKALDALEYLPSELRLLLKVNPKNITSETIDLKHFLWYN